MASRFEGGQAGQQQQQQKGQAPPKASNAQPQPHSPFERSVRALERDLRLLPASACGKTAAPVAVASAKIKVEAKMSSESDSDDDDDEEEEEQYELTEWRPPSDWSCLQRVFVTDVTVDDVSISIRESKTPEGFFASCGSSPPAAAPVAATQ